MKINIDFVNNIIRILFEHDMTYWSTFWTAIGSIVGACVLGVTVYQLWVQNKRQNELDERQNKIEEREKYQIELNIKQSLFERRISSWNILSALLTSTELQLYFSGKSDIYPLFMYIDLTNNYYLESIQGALGTMDSADREWRTNPKIQNEFLKKLSEMENFSKEITLLFSGKEIDELKKFVNLYCKLLKNLHSDQIIVDAVRQDTIYDRKNFDDLSKSAGLSEKGEKVFKEFESLRDIAQEIIKNNYINLLHILMILSIKPSVRVKFYSRYNFYSLCF